MKKTILIHHHCTFNYIENKYKTRSFIAHWVNELNKYFDVGLLIHESRSIKSQNDSLIDSDIKIHNLGKEGRRWDRIKRINRIKEVCRNVSKEYEVLLIRGITPRQYTIFKYCDISTKAFLFVGSLSDSVPPLSYFLKNPYGYIFHFIRKYEMKLISSSSTMFSNSMTALKEIESFCKTKAYFTSTNTVSENILKRNFKKTNCQKIKLTFCGRIVRDKGVIELLEAFFILYKKNDQFQLNFIGVISEKFKKEIINLKYWNSIKKDVIFNDFVPFGDRLFQHLKDSSILVLPSYHEGFPHTIWEAAVMKVPVIVTDVGGIKSLITENDAYFIKPRSSSEIVNAVNFLIKNSQITKNKINNLSKVFLKYSLESGVMHLVKKINNL